MMVNNQSMSTSYSFYDSVGLYIVRFAAVAWVGFLIRSLYWDIFCRSVNYFQVASTVMFLIISDRERDGIRDK